MPVKAKSVGSPLREQAELSMAVAISREQFKRGESFSTDDVFAEINDMLLEGKRTGKYKCTRGS